MTEIRGWRITYKSRWDHEGYKSYEYQDRVWTDSFGAIRFHAKAIHDEGLGSEIHISRFVREGPELSLGSYHPTPTLPMSQLPSWIKTKRIA